MSCRKEAGWTRTPGFEHLPNPQHPLGPGAAPKRGQSLCSPPSALLQGSLRGDPCVPRSCRWLVLWPPVSPLLASPAGRCRAGEGVPVPMQGLCVYPRGAAAGRAQAALVAHVQALAGSRPSPAGHRSPLHRATACSGLAAAAQNALQWEPPFCSRAFPSQRVPGPGSGPEQPKVG